MKSSQQRPRWIGAAAPLCALLLVGSVATCCGSGSSSLSQRIVTPPASYFNEPQTADNVSTGAQTIHQVAGANTQDLSALRSCGWVSGQLRYWIGGPCGIWDGWQLRVNQFARPRGARCFQAFIYTRLLHDSSYQTSSTVPSLPGAWELSTSTPRLVAIDILFRSGHYWVVIAAAGPRKTKALVESIARKQNELLRA